MAQTPTLWPGLIAAGDPRFGFGLCRKTRNVPVQPMGRNFGNDISPFFALPDDIACCLLHIFFQFSRRISSTAFGWRIHSHCFCLRPKVKHCKRIEVGSESIAKRGRPDIGGVCVTGACCAGIQQQNNSQGASGALDRVGPDPIGHGRVDGDTGGSHGGPRPRGTLMEMHQKRH